MTERLAGLNRKPNDFCWEWPYAGDAHVGVLPGKVTSMRLSDFLDFDSMRVDLGVSNKRQLLQMLGQIAGARAGFDPAMIVDSLVERERLGTTGFGRGVAIPHGKVEGLESIYGMAVRLADPVDYKSVDGEKVDLVFLLLSPPDAGAAHLKSLAAISRTVRSESTLQKLRGARSRDAFAAVLMAADERDAA